MEMLSCGHSASEAIRNQIGGNSGIDCRTCHQACKDWDAGHVEAYIESEVVRKVQTELNRRYAEEEERIMRGDPNAEPPQGVIVAPRGNP
jgi:Fe-S-cluster-containing dehydrogenase component